MFSVLDCNHGQILNRRSGFMHIPGSPHGVFSGHDTTMDSLNVIHGRHKCSSGLTTKRVVFRTDTHGNFRDAGRHILDRQMNSHGASGTGAFHINNWQLPQHSQILKNGLPGYNPVMGVAHIGALNDIRTINIGCPNRLKSRLPPQNIIILLVFAKHGFTNPCDINIPLKLHDFLSSGTAAFLNL